MFQSFEVISHPNNGASRVAKLRTELETLGLDGFLVPHTDEHQGEYVPPHAQRLAWLTGFTGSAGIALILRQEAFLFVDGRYTLQTRMQIDLSVFTIENLLDMPLNVWLAKHGENLTLGFDPWLYTIAQARTLRETLHKIGGQFVPIQDNPIDQIWTDQLPAPLAPVTIHPLIFAGRDAQSKLSNLSIDIRNSGAQATILTDPASIAWAFNIRGKDVSNTPLPLAFAILVAEGKPSIFIDSRKLSNETEAYLAQMAILRSPLSLEDDLKLRAASGEMILLDPTLAAEKLHMIIAAAGGKIIEGKDPTRLSRAMKNNTELAGARCAHERDGVAMITFLSWLDEQEPGTIDEITAAIKLEETRRNVAETFQMPLEDIAFDTISCSGEHGAIIHYRVNMNTNRVLQNGELYLIDSGGQYRDGTTDITRTIPIGVVSQKYKRAFTLVLKGMIAISTARFPKGTRGMDIDILARIALWKAGFDFAHGTGHGVGSYLSVHEGPQNISRRGTQELLPGMILSNEPGYYKPGDFGIRIENLMIVTEPEVIEDGDIAMMGFETLTLCPIDYQLIDLSLLTKEELVWLNTYHADVRKKLLPHIRGNVHDWLMTSTNPLKIIQKRNNVTG